MKRFYYFLNENPHYPQMIYAKSKNDVVSILINDMGEMGRESIIKILSEEEYLGKSNNTNQRQNSEQSVDESTNESGDFVTNALNNLTAMNEDVVIDENVPQNVDMNNNNNIVKNTNLCPKYFSAGGDEFKLENDILYKKVWATVKNSDEFRIVKSDTGKPIKSDKYLIETLVWKEVEN